MVSRLDAVVVRDVCRPKGRDQAVKGKNGGAKAQEYSKGSNKSHLLSENILSIGFIFKANRKMNN